MDFTYEYEGRVYRDVQIFCLDKVNVSKNRLGLNRCIELFQKYDLRCEGDFLTCIGRGQFLQDYDDTRRCYPKGLDVLIFAMEEHQGGYMYGGQNANFYAVSTPFFVSAPIYQPAFEGADKAFIEGVGKALEEKSAEACGKGGLTLNEENFRWERLHLAPSTLPAQYSRLKALGEELRSSIPQGDIGSKEEFESNVGKVAQIVKKHGFRYEESRKVDISGNWWTREGVTLMLNGDCFGFAIFVHEQRSGSIRIYINEFDWELRQFAKKMKR